MLESFCMARTVVLFEGVMVVNLALVVNEISEGLAVPLPAWCDV